MSSQGGPLEWVNFLLFTGSKKMKRMKIGILFNFWWQLWKERNRCIFEDKHQSPLQVLSLLKDQISCLFMAPDVTPS
jgi:hypothetical protein